MGLTALLVGTAATPTAAATAGLIGTAGAISTGAAIGIGVAAAGASGAFSKSKGPDIPSSVTAASTTPSKTAKRIEPVTDPDKKKRRSQAAVFAQGFAPPQLGKPGLLGLGV